MTRRSYTTIVPDVVNEPPHPGHSRADRTLWGLLAEVHPWIMMHSGMFTCFLSFRKAPSLSHSRRSAVLPPGSRCATGRTNQRPASSQCLKTLSPIAFAFTFTFTFTFVDYRAPSLPGCTSMRIDVKESHRTAPQLPRTPKAACYPAAPEA